MFLSIIGPPPSLKYVFIAVIVKGLKHADSNVSSSRDMDVPIEP